MSKYRKIGQLQMGSISYGPKSFHPKSFDPKKYGYFTSSKCHMCFPKSIICFFGKHKILKSFDPKNVPPKKSWSKFSDRNIKH